MEFVAGWRRESQQRATAINTELDVAPLAGSRRPPSAESQERKSAFRI
jgi:hypothetical protein